jgi:MoaA/NifB/PqqE/SkfB family radical SAM enzyme
MFLRVFVLALKRYKNPVAAIRNLKKFADKRMQIQGYEKIPRYVKCDDKYHFADQIPGFPSNAFDRFFEQELIRIDGNRENKILLNTIIFGITSSCPLQCTHCYDFENINSKEYLQTGDLLIILEKLKKTGLTHIQFGGGEPLSRFNDLLILITKAKPFMDCWLLTSGFGLTPERAKALKKAGLTGASISLDHWNETAHNTFRNHEKSFFWVREAVKNCREAGIMVTIALCATKEFTTPENIRKYYKQAKDWGAGFIKILEARKTGRFSGKDIMLTPDQITFLMEFYLKSYTDKRFSDYPIAMFPGFDQRQVGCLGAGNRYMYIDSKGEIHACPFCHGPVGNALHDNLPDAILKLRKSGCQVFHLSNF